MRQRGQHVECRSVRGERNRQRGSRRALCVFVVRRQFRPIRHWVEGTVGHFTFGRTRAGVHSFHWKFGGPSEVNVVFPTHGGRTCLCNGWYGLGRFEHRTNTKNFLFVVVVV